MKHLYLLAILLIISSTSCSKKDTDIPIGNTDEFNMVGIEDVYMAANSSYSLYLGINQIPDEKDSIMVSIAGLPDKVTYTFSKQSDTSSFTTTLTFHSDYVSEGTYPLVITATTASGKTQKQHFNLFIRKYNDCTLRFLGKIFGGACFASQGSLNHMTNTQATVYADGNKPNGLLFDLPVLHPLKLPTILDCEKNTVIIPEFHNVGDTVTVTVTGSGTFAKNTMEFTIHTVRITPERTSIFTCTYVTYL